MKKYLLISFSFLSFIAFSYSQIDLVKDFNSSSSGAFDTDFGDAAITEVNGENDLQGSWNRRR